MPWRSGLSLAECCGAVGGHRPFGSHRRFPAGRLRLEGGLYARLCVRSRLTAPLSGRGIPAGWSGRGGWAASIRRLLADRWGAKMATSSVRWACTDVGLADVDVAVFSDVGPRERISFGYRQPVIWSRPLVVMGLASAPRATRSTPAAQGVGVRTPCKGLWIAAVSPGARDYYLSVPLIPRRRPQRLLCNPFGPAQLPVSFPQPPGSRSLLAPSLRREGISPCLLFKNLPGRV